MKTVHLRVTSDTLASCAEYLLRSQLFTRVFIRDCDTGTFGRLPANISPEDEAELISIVRQRFSVSLGTAEAGVEDILADIPTIAILDSLGRWLYRSTEGIVRTAYYAISCVTGPIMYNARNRDHFRPFSSSAFQLDDLRASMLQDNSLFVADVFRRALIPAPLEAKLPIAKSAHVYQRLSEISAPDRQQFVDGQLVEESMHYLNSTDVATPIAIRLDGPDARESAIRRLFQTVMAISGYKNERSHSELRSFLNTAGTVAHLIKFSDDTYNDEVNDVLATLVPVERLAQNFSHTANTLLQRAKSGQIVYAEMQNLCTQWYSLVNADLMLVFKLLAHLMITFEGKLDAIGPNMANAYRLTTESMFKRGNIYPSYTAARAGIRA